MSRTIDFRPVARRELERSIEWYEKQRFGLGAALQAEVEDFLARIAAQPELFRKIRGEVRRAVLRRFPYSIHFLTEAGRIVVLAVFHAKRDPSRLKWRR